MSQKRKNKKDKEDAEKQRLEEEVAATTSGGPSLRDIELKGIQKELMGIGREIKTILSDGHCLYRAVADQLEVRR